MIADLMNKPLAQFFMKLFACLALVFILDRGIGHFLKKYYFTQKAGYYYQATYAIDSTKADIVILGSSRAANIFDPTVFEEQLTLSCFNTGRYGYPIFYHYAVLKAITKRHLPKIVVLSFDAGNFSVNQEAYDRLSSLLPYYKNHPEIRPMVDLKEPYINLKMLSAIYPFNSLILQIISGNTNHSVKKYATVKGYIPLDENITWPLVKFNYTTEVKLDTVKINTYKAFLQYCINANIKLFVVCPPYLIDAKGTDLSIITAKKISADFKIQFLDYSRDSFYTARPQLFADYRHLNKNGVGMFSLSVIDKMKDSSRQFQH